MNPSQELLHNNRSSLDRACGETSVSQSDAVWDEIVKFPSPLTRLAPDEFAASAAPFFEAFVAHNGRTNNLSKFLWHICGLLRRASKSSTAQRITDMLCFTRVLFKHLTEYLTAAQLSTLLKADAPDSGAQDIQNGTGEARHSLLQTLIRAVLELLLHGSLGPRTYMAHLEAVQLLLVMASTQLYSPTATGHWGAHPLTEAMLTQADLVPGVVQRLLQHAIERQPLPPHAPVYTLAPGDRPSVLRLVRSAAASVLMLPYTAFTFLVRSGGPQPLPGSPLGDASRLLLLVLLHHAPPLEIGISNPFRAALQQLQDSEEETGDAVEGGQGHGSSQASVPYSALYTALGSSMSEASVLLLYNLLHTCQHFRNYVFIRGDLDVLVVPLLQQLYITTGHAPSQLYMLLIVILILSQDAGFAQNLHQITLPSVPWFKERLLHRTSLGSLLVAVLLRTAHRNLGRLKDVYLHTNMLAALTNLAPHFQGLSAHAAQRLVSLLDVLQRKYLRSARQSLEHAAWESSEEEASVYVDFLRLVLEMINTVLVTCLPQNPELVYALLHRQDVLAPLQENPRFAELTRNIALAVAFFNERVEDSKAADGWEWSVERVLDVINAALKQWRTDGLKHFPELHFTYEEESAPEEFFVPYIWTLVVTHTSIPWNNQNICLFAPIDAADDNRVQGQPTLAAGDRTLSDARLSVADDV